VKRNDKKPFVRTPRDAVPYDTVRLRSSFSVPPTTVAAIVFRAPLTLPSRTIDAYIITRHSNVSSRPQYYASNRSRRVSLRTGAAIRVSLERRETRNSRPTCARPWGLWNVKIFLFSIIACRDRKAYDKYFCRFGFHKVFWNVFTLISTNDIYVSPVTNFPAFSLRRTFWGFLRSLWLFRFRRIKTPKYFPGDYISWAICNCLRRKLLSTEDVWGRYTRISNFRNIPRIPGTRINNL